jgi:hypothetical protein
VKGIVQHWVLPLLPASNPSIEIEASDKMQQGQFNKGNMKLMYHEISTQLHEANMSLFVACTAQAKSG